MIKDELYEKYKNLIFKVIRDTHCVIKTQNDFQRYFDAGELGLLNAINNYDESKPQTSTFFYICIKNSILKHFKSYTMQKRYNNLLDMSFDYCNENIDLYNFVEDKNSNIENNFLKNEKIKILYKAIDSLKPKYQDLIKNLYGINTNKITVSEYAKRVHKTRENISARKTYALKKLKEKYIELGGTFYD